jgi:hypothetical protein
MALLWSTAINPALAILLARALPLAEPYALGLILPGLAAASLLGRLNPASSPVHGKG